MQQRKPDRVDLFAWSKKMVRYHLLGWVIYTFLFFGINQLNHHAPSFASIVLVTPMAMLVMYGVVATLLVASKLPTSAGRWLAGAGLLTLALLVLPLVSYGYVYGLMKAMGMEIQVPDAPFSIREFIKNNVLGFARYGTYGAVYFAIGRWMESHQAHFVARELSMRRAFALLQARNERQEFELTALQTQLSPHLQHALFNKLYGRALRNDSQLPESILLMSEIAAYATKATERSQALVPVHHELKVIHKLAALAGHAQAMADAKRYLDCHDLPRLDVPRLSLVTLFENAVKFADTRPGQPPIVFRLDTTPSPPRLCFTCSNKIGTATRHEASLGTGLVNLRRRLALLFKGHASLYTHSEGGFFHAHLHIYYAQRE